MSGTAWEGFSNRAAHHVEMKGDKFGRPRGIKRYNLVSAID